MRMSDWSSDVCSSDLQAADVRTASARRLEQGGAAALLICANSMHRVYDEVQAGVDIPIVNIAEAVGRKMQADGIEKAALIGTRNVMTEKFYRQRLEIGRAHV